MISSLWSFVVHIPGSWCRKGKRELSCTHYGSLRFRGGFLFLCARSTRMLKKRAGLGRTLSGTGSLNPLSAGFGVHTRRSDPDRVG